MWRPALIGRATRPASGLRGILLHGEFGPQTRRALTAFQRAQGLASDGVVGKGTWGVLVTHGRQRSPARC
jgi:peptidoglycan hydrolase-like protein with peptidoglycan-binding domain